MNFTFTKHGRKPSEFLRAFILKALPFLQSMQLTFAKFEEQAWMKSKAIHIKLFAEIL